MFDLPQQHVSRSILATFLQGFSSTRTAINEAERNRELSYSDPVANAKRIAAIHKQIAALKKQMISPADVEKYMAHATAQFKKSAESSDRVYRGRAASEAKSTKTKIESGQKSVAKTIESHLESKGLSKRLDTSLTALDMNKLGEGSIEAPKDFNANVEQIKGANPHARTTTNEAILLAVATKAGMTADSDAVIPNTGGMTQGEMVELIQVNYGLYDSESDRERPQDKERMKQEINLAKEGVKKEINKKRVRPRGGVDTSVATAKKASQETYQEYKDAVTKENKALQDQIDALTLKQDALTLNQARVASGEIPPYEFYEKGGLGRWGPGLGTVMVTEGRKPKLREGKPSPFPPMASSEEPVGEVEALPLEAEVEQPSELDFTQMTRAQSRAELGALQAGGAMKYPASLDRLTQIPDDLVPDDMDNLNQMLMLDPYVAPRRPPVEGGVTFGTASPPPITPRVSDEEMRRTIEERRRWGELDPDVPDRVYHDPAPHMQIDDLKFDEHGRPYSTAVPMPTTWAYGTGSPPPIKTQPTREQLLSQIQEQQEFSSIVEDEDDMGIINAMPGSLEPRIEGPFPSFIEAQKYQVKFKRVLRNYEIGEQEGQFYLVPPDFGEQLINPTGFQL